MCAFQAERTFFKFVRVQNLMITWALEERCLEINVILV